MDDSKSSIFRASAVERHLQRQEETVLPRFISPPTWVCLWLLLGLLMAGGIVVWSAKTPVFTSGSALISVWPERLDSVYGQVGPGEMVVIAFLPPEYLSRLQIGQTLFLQPDRAGGRLGSKVIGVMPDVVSPEAARKMFAINAGGVRPLTQPSAVAIARFELPPASPPATSYAGSVYNVEVEVGSRRVISFLPLIGHFFGE
jgi:hypothetical protein